MSILQTIMEPFQNFQNWSRLATARWQPIKYLTSSSQRDINFLESLNRESVSQLGFSGLWFLKIDVNRIDRRLPSIEDKTIRFRPCVRHAFGGMEWKEAGWQLHRLVRTVRRSRYWRSDSAEPAAEQIYFYCAL